MKNIFAALAAIVLLAGCAHLPHESSALPEMTFDNLEPIFLNVSAVVVRNDYLAPMTLSNVENFFTVPPAAATENLLKKRLQATGRGEKVLRAIIQDASILQENLPVEKGVFGFFKPEPESRLKARLYLRFEIINRDAPDIVLAHADVEDKRDKTLMKGMSVAERARARFDLMEELMRDLNRGLTTVVKGTLEKALMP